MPANLRPATLRWLAPLVLCGFVLVAALAPAQQTPNAPAATAAPSSAAPGSAAPSADKGPQYYAARSANRASEPTPVAGVTISDPHSLLTDVKTETKASTPTQVTGETVTVTKTAPAPSQSLADIARGLRDKKKVEVKTTPEDAKELFAAVDKIFKFASDDTLLDRKATVKRQLVSQADVEKFFQEKTSKAEYTQRFDRAELTMKKFGLLPADFHLREFLVKANKEQVAGFYDDETKTISLLNWVPLETQRPVLAHELTHALQDQNFNLRTWMKRPNSAPAGKEGKFQIEDEESPAARQAVVEGQAMVVFIDYLFSPFGKTLEDAPGLVAAMEDPSVTAVIDTPLTHAAPIILRETGTFPYKEGLLFEAEVLQHGGRQKAFAGMFAHPPKNTHEVLDPRAYLEGDKAQGVTIPDVRPLLSGKYEVSDTGSFGALDLRALLKQHGQRKASAELSAAWRGGAYATFRPSGAASADPASLSLLYVSRWKSDEMAEHFAQVYGTMVASRYKSVQARPAPGCSGKRCPESVLAFTTEQGPVIIEHWADSVVVVSESFEETTAARLRDAVLSDSGRVRVAQAEGMELNQRLYELAAFRAYQAEIGNQIWGATAAYVKNNYRSRQ